MRNCDAGAEACCGTRGWRKGQAPRKVARNSIEQSFNKVRKRCNSNDLNSMFEIVAGELRAKLPGRRGLAGLQDNAPSNISDQAPLVWRAPERPVGLAAGPVGDSGARPG